MSLLRTFLSNGYFPKELPPIFSTEDFAEKTYNSANLDILSGNRWQHSSPYFLRLKAHERRKLDILGPQSILKISSLIANNYSEFNSRISRLDGHISQPKIGGSGKFRRAIQPKTTGKNYSQRKLQLRSRFPTIIKLDIKNYYRSIYTHSLPWAFHSKEVAKNNVSNTSLIGNRLDKAIMFGQDGQTIGIPTGPDTSFLLSEILLSSIFKLLIYDEKIIDDRFIRYYDDIEYGCESETEAHQILSVFQDYLNTFELEINPDKVEIFSGPSNVESPWLYQIREIKDYDRINTNGLIELFAFLADLSKKYPNDFVYRYFLRKMRGSIIHENAWPTYQSILLALFHEEKGNAKEIFDQFRYYSELGWEIDKASLKEALDRKAMKQLRSGVTSELSWAIYGYLLFDLKLERTIGDTVLKYGDVPSKILVTKMIYEQGLPLKSTLNSIIKSFDRNVLNSKEWLFAYEILVNGWHNRYYKVDISENPELFELLRDKEVSFIDESKDTVELPNQFQRLIDGTFEEDDWVDHFERDEEDEDEEDDDYGLSEDEEEDEDDFWERLFRDD